MAFQPVPDVMEITVHQTLFTVPVVNVFHVLGEAPFTETQLSTVAASVLSSWGLNIMPVMSEDLKLVSVDTRDLSVEGGGGAVEALGSPSSGGFGGPSTSGNVAFCLTLRTGRLGRSYRGRKYFAGLPEAHVAANLFDATRAAALVTGFSAVLATLAEGDWQAVVVSRKNGGVLRPAGVATPVTAVIARDLKVDTQRRRLS